MVVDAIDKPEALSYHAVSLTSAEGDNQYWTDWNQFKIVEGLTFLPVPEMEIKLPVNDGLLNEQDCRVAIPFIDDPDDLGNRLTSGEPHADVTMQVWEIYEDPTGSTPKVINLVFIGIIVKGRRNFENRPDLIMLQALPEKGRIAKASQGVQCNVECSNVLGGRYCTVDLVPHTFTVGIASIDVGELTMTGIPTGKDDRYFQRGYVESQGLRINIQDWRNAAAGDESKVQLMIQAPARWVGRQVTIVAGCDKSVAICRSRFDNEEHIRPLGFSMPAYDPQFEGDSAKG